MSEGRPELEHIVRGTDQCPFAAHLPHSAQQELSIATALLDLAEHRFDNRFAPRIQLAALRRAEGATHPISHRLC